MELRHILEVLWRRKWLVVGVFFAVFLTIVIGTLLITPWYDSTAKVLLRRSSAQSSIFSSLGMQSSAMQSSSISDTDRADYLALAGVRPVAEVVVADLGVTRLKTRARIMKAIPFIKPVLRLVGVDVNFTEEKMKAQDLLDSSILSMIFPRPHVDLDQYEETDIIEIEATSPDPVQAAGIANKMASVFIGEELKRVREDYKGASQFIESNISNARSEYLNALRDLKTFKEREKTVNIDTETTNLIQRVSDLKKQLSDNNLTLFKDRAAIARSEAQLRDIPKYQKSSESLKDNEMILSLKQTLRDLYLSLAETKSKYTKEHPAVVDLENKIEQTKDLIDKEIRKVYSGETVAIDPAYQDVYVKLSGYYTEVAAIEAQNDVLPKVIRRYEAEMMALPAKAAEYAQLNLAVTVTQDVYNSVLKYRYQVGMAESMALANIYLVEPALVAEKDDSKHRHPNLLLNTLIAIVLGGPFGIGAALLLEYLDDTVRSSNDVKAFKNLTFLGSIFRLRRKEPKLVSTVDPRSPLREVFRTIRNSVRFATPDKPPKSIVITSSVQEEGKSFLASNLAISMAGDGKRVILIDGDMRRPGLQNYFKLPNTVGLTNYLVGDAELGAAVQATGIEGLSVILTGPIPPDPAKLVESKKMHQLIREMEESYDLVIIDSPPLMPASDAVIFGRWTDGVVILMECGRASKRHMADMLETLHKAGINVIGAVLNKMPVGGTSYYYYYYRKYE